MKLSSIRWWLPLSYGAVAFITAVSLSLVLLVALQSYYTWQEQRYLQGNMQSINDVVHQILESGADNLLPSQIDTFAYLTQTQIDVYGADGELIASSQNPRDLQAVATLSLQIDTGTARQALSQTIDSSDSQQAFTSLLVLEGENGRLTSTSSVSGDLVDLGTVAGFASPLLRLETPNSYEMGTADNQARSAQQFRQTLPNGRDGRTAGVVVLSQGPAFGRAALINVAVGMAVAGIVAVVMATAVGWLMSRRISHPIYELVDVTHQMAAGNLSVRTQVSHPDELNQLGHAFNEMAARIEQTIASLRQFVADAAHELNTPLTALRANLELAAQSSPKNSYLANAQSQTLRLQHLNDHLLGLLRLESGIDREAWQPVDLAQLVAVQSERYAAQAEQAGLTFGVQYPPTPLVVSGVSENIERAMGNLVDNALKFTPSGGDIQVGLTAVPDWAIFMVRDTGIGIVKADMGLLFGRFHRGRNAGEYPGSGLGLAIVRQIATMHGGDVTAVRLHGCTEFILRLPLIK